MYTVCVRRFYFASFCDFPRTFWNISNGVAFLFHLIYIKWDILNLKSHEGYCRSCMYSIIALFRNSRINFTHMVHVQSEEINNCYLYFTKMNLQLLKTMYCETALCLQTENDNGNFRSKQTCMQIIMIKCSIVSNIDRIKIQL